MNEAASRAMRPLPERWSPLAVASLVLSVLPVGSAVAPVLGAAIDRVRRVLSRARPSWPAEPPGEAREQD